MALIDWLWLVRLIIEILKLIAQLPDEELRAIAALRNVVDLPGIPRKRQAKKNKSAGDPPSSQTT